MHKQFCSIISLLLLVVGVARGAVITLSPGFAMQNNGEAKTLLLQTSPSSLSNTYTASKRWSAAFDVQAFFGKVFYRDHAVKLQSGLTIGYVDSMAIHGLVQQFALPSFANLSYRYNVSSFLGLATWQASLLSSNKWQPYVMTGIGLANNHSSGYQENPLINGAVPMQPFAGRTMTSFAYAFGAGLMYNVSKLLSVGFGYQFADLGQASLGVSPVQDTAQTLNLKHLYLQQWLFHMSWQV